jgi:DNA-binding MarR family transcriptional regulator
MGWGQLLIFGWRLIDWSVARDPRIQEKFGFPQKELGDHLGLHYPTVSRILNEEISK